MKLSVFYDHVVQAHEQTGKNIRDILIDVRNYGVEALEIRLSDIQENSGVIDLIKQTGFSISCIYEFYEMGITDEIAKVKAHLDMAKSLEAPNIMIVPGFLQGDDVSRLKADMADASLLNSFFDSNAEVKQMAKCLNQAVTMGKELHINVLFEDFDDFSSPMSGINGVAWFLDKCPEIGYTFDCGNFIMYDEDVLEAFGKFRSRIQHVHCKDRSIEPVAVGDGRIPIDKVVTALLKSGYKGYFAIEHFDAKNQLECIRKSASFLHACEKNISEAGSKNNIIVEFKEHFEKAENK